MDVRSTQRLFPVGRAAVAYVSELGRTRCHSLAEFGREAVQRVLRYAERLQALIREADGDPGVVGGIGRRPSGVDNRVQSPDQLASRGSDIDAQQEVGADVRRWPLVQRPTLDVVEL